MIHLFVHDDSLLESRDWSYSQFSKQLNCTFREFLEILIVPFLVKFRMTHYFCLDLTDSSF